MVNDKGKEMVANLLVQMRVCLDAGVSPAQLKDAVERAVCQCAIHVGCKSGAHSKHVLQTREPQSA